LNATDESFVASFITNSGGIAKSASTPSFVKRITAVFHTHKRTGLSRACEHKCHRDNHSEQGFHRIILKKIWALRGREKTHKTQAKDYFIGLE
jgi:hypothetical protein